MQCNRHPWPACAPSVHTTHARTSHATHLGSNPQAAMHRKLVDRQIARTKALLRQIEVHKAIETAALRRREDSAETAVGDWVCSILPQWDEVRHPEPVRAKATRRSSDLPIV